MKTSHIQDIFKEYLNTSETQYALLINGTWGSGKTFFWKTTLKEIVHRQNLNPIYLSLNGLSTAAQLQQHLMIKLIPFFGKSENRTLKNVLRLTGNVGTAAAKIFKVDLSKIMSGVTLDGFKFTDKVVCFDDLERCQMPIKEVLGFINDFVEHKNLKCIILADAVKMNDYDQYLEIKEKVIGRELDYEPELKSVLPTLYERYKNHSLYYRFLQTHQDYIFGVFFEYDEFNLRIISFFLDSLYKVHETLDSFESQFQQEVILFIAVISIEFKRGKLSSTDIDDPYGLKDVNYFRFQTTGKNTPMGGLFATDNKEPEIEPNYNEIFYLKYVEGRIEEFQYYNSIYRYILSGYLDSQKLNSELKARKPEEQSAEVKDFMRLVQYDFRSIPSQEFKELVPKVLSNAENGIYTLYDYDRLSNFYHFFSKNGLIDKTNDEIDKLLSKGIDLAAKRKEINHKVYDNLAHFAVSMPEMQPVRDKIKTVHNLIKAEQEALESNVLIEILENENMEGFDQLFEVKKYSNDFLKYIDGEQLFQILQPVSNATLHHFTNAMRRRYKGATLKHIFPDDYHCINEMKELVVNLIVDNKDLDRLRLFNWEELNEILQRACGLLKPTDGILEN